jgi:hypothetical protein
VSIVELKQRREYKKKYHESQNNTRGGAGRRNAAEKLLKKMFAFEKSRSYIMNTGRTHGF